MFIFRVTLDSKSVVRAEGIFSHLRRLFRIQRTWWENASLWLSNLCGFMKAGIWPSYPQTQLASTKKLVEMHPLPMQPTCQCLYGFC